jgi:hypothetical protein
MQVPATSNAGLAALAAALLAFASVRCATGGIACAFCGGHGV